MGASCFVTAALSKSKATYLFAGKRGLHISATLKGLLLLRLHNLKLTWDHGALPCSLPGLNSAYNKSRRRATLAHQEQRAALLVSVSCFTGLRLCSCLGRNVDTANHGTQPREQGNRHFLCPVLPTKETHPATTVSKRFAFLPPPG